MKAVLNTPDGPGIADVADPRPAADEALVAARAFSINRGELAMPRVRPARRNAAVRLGLRSCCPCIGEGARRKVARASRLARPPKAARKAGVVLAQHRAQLVGDLHAVRDRVLMGTRKHMNRLRQLRVNR